MIFLNTYWTPAYILMLVFVFWLARLIYGWLRPMTLRQQFDDNFNLRYRIVRFLFCVLATFFFHSVW